MDASLRGASIVKTGRELYLVWPNAAYKALGISLRNEQICATCASPHAMGYRNPNLSSLIRSDPGQVSAARVIMLMHVRQERYRYAA